MEKKHTPIDGTPCVQTLIANRDRQFSWEDALSELVSNSANAGASEIEIYVRRSDNLCVTDNGCGFKDMAHAIRSGLRYEHGLGSDNGKFGVGLKDALNWLWGRATIESSNREHTFQSYIDWEECLSKEQWPGEQTYCETNGSPEKTGTTISVNAHIRKTQGYLHAARRLCWRFLPYAKAGKSLTFRGSNQKIRWSPSMIQDPILSDEINVNGNVGGLGYSFRAGELKSDEEFTGRFNFSREGIHVVYGHHIICELPEAFGGNPVSNFFGWIELSAKWKPYLNRNKNGLTAWKDELASEIYGHIKDLVERLGSRLDDLELDSLSSELDDCIFGQRAIEDEDGTLESTLTKKRSVNPSPFPNPNPGFPTDEGLSPSTVDSNAPRSRRIRYRARGVKLMWVSAGAGGDVGSAELSDDNVCIVKMNRDHEAVKRAWRRKKIGRDRMPFNLMVIPIICEYLSLEADEKQTVFMFQREKQHEKFREIYTTLVNRVLKTQDIKDNINAEPPCVSEDLGSENLVAI